jgi:quinoprotein glucose dehydrogenase
MHAQRVIVVVAATTLASLTMPAAQTPGEWSLAGGDAANTKYSALSQIRADNVAALDVVWTWKTGEMPRPEYGTVPGKFEATPLVIDGTMYVVTPYNRVVALDAATGAERWSYDPKSYEAGMGPEGVEFGKHRGIVTWTNGTERRLFLNTRWRLIALDAKTGIPIPGFGTNGEVDLTTGLVWGVADKVHYMNTSPGIVYRDLLILGSAISDRLIYRKSPPGDVRAFDVRTGRQVWTFRTVPQRGELGNDSWHEDSWRYTGHANAWAPLALDDKRGLVYVPVSTPAYDYYGGGRLGDNLFGDSLVCLDANTGRRVWHFQTIHHGLWDYDGVFTPNLLTIRVDGQPVDVAAAVSKNGFTYVFDRVTGRPVWPIEERPVPQSDVSGERTSPTQPIPTKPPPFARQGITEDDLVDFTPELRAEALARLRSYRYGPVYTPPSLQGTVLMPANGGGSNWGGSSVDPDTGFLYVKATNWPRLVTLTPVKPGSPPDPSIVDAGEARYRWRSPTTVNVAGAIPLTKPPYSTLTAIDLNRGAIAWQVPLGDAAFVRNHPALKGKDLPPLLGGAFGNAGALVTRGGLVFISAGDTKLYAFDKTDGKVLFAGALPAEGSGTPMTYLTRTDRQLVVIATGGGSNAALVAFALRSPSTR